MADGAKAADQAAALEQLVSLERIDWTALRHNISSLTEHRGEVTLAEVLGQHPITSGSVEILAYLQIAFDDGHVIDQSETVSLPVVFTDGTTRWVRLPNVIFIPASRREGRFSLLADSEAIG